MSYHLDPQFNESLEKIRQEHVDSLKMLKACIAKQSSSIQSVVRSLQTLVPELLELEIRTADLIDNVDAKQGDDLVQSIYSSNKIHWRPSCR